MSVEVPWSRAATLRLLANLASQTTVAVEVTGGTLSVQTHDVGERRAGEVYWRRRGGVYTRCDTATLDPVVRWWVQSLALLCRTIMGNAVASCASRARVVAVGARPSVDPKGCKHDGPDHQRANQFGGICTVCDLCGAEFDG